MSQLSEAFEDAWGRFCAAFESGDDEASLSALQEWIIAWDDCVQAEETEAFAVAYHEDVVALNHVPLPGARNTHGLEAFRAQLHEVPDIANHFRFEINEFERSGDRFMGAGRFRARGRYSGLVMRFPLARRLGLRRRPDQAGAGVRDPPPRSGRAARYGGGGADGDRDP